MLSETLSSRFAGTQLGRTNQRNGSKVQISEDKLNCQISSQYIPHSK